MRRSGTTFAPTQFFRVPGRECHQHRLRGPLATHGPATHMSDGSHASQRRPRSLAADGGKERFAGPGSRRWGRCGYSMRQASGLTLLEVVIAVAVLAIGVLAAAGLQASSLRANRVAQDLQRLDAMASSRLAEWRGIGLSPPVSQTHDCSHDGITCAVVVTPCLAVSGGLNCELTSVADPVAHAISVTVASV